MPVEEYKLKLMEVGKKQKELHRGLIEMADEFMKNAFEKNPNEISLDDVLRFAKGKPLKPILHPCGF